MAKTKMVVNHCSSTWQMTIVTQAGREIRRFVEHHSDSGLMFVVRLLLAVLFLIVDAADGVCSWPMFQRIVPADPSVAAFGSSTAVDGDNLIVGGSGLDSSAAFVFQEEASGNWIEIATLVPSNGSTDDRFGNDVAISGDLAIVGAYKDDERGDGAGAAYIFRHSGSGRWNEVAKLTASDAVSGDGFGFSVGISGDTAVIGAISPGPGGNNATSTYFFQRNDVDEWSEIASFQTNMLSDGFGFSVAISGDVALVGAPDDSGSAYHAGGLYIYRRDSAGAWNPAGKIISEDAEMLDDFGWSVALSGDKALIGAVYSEGSGAAYLYDLAEPEPRQIAKLSPSDGRFGDNFGNSLALAEDMAVIGSVRHAADGNILAGAAYVFRPNEEGEWKELAKLSSEVPAPNQIFGRSVAATGQVAIVGANREVLIYRIPEPSTTLLLLFAAVVNCGSGRRYCRTVP